MAVSEVLDRTSHEVDAQLHNAHTDERHQIDAEELARVECEGGSLKRLA